MRVDIGDASSIRALYGRIARVDASSAQRVKAGLEGFARSAALELPRGIRLNVVSYVASVEGKQTGTVIDPRSLQR